MPLTELERLDCIEHCFANWRVRLTPRTSQWLIHDCLDLIEADGVADVHLRPRMVYKARAASRKVWRPVKSAWVIILLQVVLPILIELVIEWWLKRRRAEA